MTLGDVIAKYRADHGLSMDKFAEEKMLAEYHVRDEGAVYVVEGPKKFLKNFCKTP